MSEDVWEIISVILLSAIKFSIGGVPLAIFYKFSFIKAVTTTSVGGILGVFTFSFISEWIINASKKILKRRQENRIKKIFTWKNKIIVWVKNKMGLIGLAILTPTLLSLPLGLFLAVRYFKDRNKIIIYMSISVFTCSVILASLKFLF